MKGSATPFYGTKEDFRILLNAFDESGEFEYIQQLSTLNTELVIYKNAIKLINTGVSKDKPHRGGGYLIVDRNKRITLERFNMRDGSGYKYSIGQNYNFDAIRIALGGYVGDNTIVESILDTRGESDRAKEMHKQFKKILMKLSKKVSRYRVLPDAYKKLEEGWRLAQGKDFQAKLDLKLE